jgi:hypothetical protein
MFWVYGCGWEITWEAIFVMKNNGIWDKVLVLLGTHWEPYWELGEHNGNKLHDHHITIWNTLGTPQVQKTNPPPYPPKRVSHLQGGISTHNCVGHHFWPSLRKGAWIVGTYLVREEMCTCTLTPNPLRLSTICIQSFEKWFTQVHSKC